MKNAQPADREEEELMDPGSWDDEAAEVRQPVRKPRAVVSVAFPAADFELVAAKAREEGATVSGYIRRAAVAHASSPVVSAHWSTSGSVITTQGPVFPTTLIDAPAEAYRSDSVSLRG